MVATNKQYPGQIDPTQQSIGDTPSQQLYRTREIIINYARQAVVSGTPLEEMRIPDQLRDAVRMWILHILSSSSKSSVPKVRDEAKDSVEIVKATVARIWNDIYEEKFTSLGRFEVALVKMIMSMGWNIRKSAAEDFYLISPGKLSSHDYLVPTLKMDPPEIIFHVDKGMERNNMYLVMPAVLPKNTVDRVSMVDIRKGEVIKRTS
jgi:hypothetical protein